MHSSKGFMTVLTIFISTVYFIEHRISEGLWAPVQTISKKPRCGDLNGLLLRSMRCLLKRCRPDWEGSKAPLHCVFFDPLRLGVEHLELMFSAKTVWAWSKFASPFGE